MKTWSKIWEHLTAPRELFWRFLLLVGTAIAISMMMTALLASFLVAGEFQVGDVATTSIRAPKDFLLVDRVSTERKRSEAAGSIKSVFVLSDLEKDLGSFQLNALFEMLRTVSEAEPGSDERPTLSAQERAEFERRFSVNLEGKEWAILEDVSNWPMIEHAVSSLVNPILRKGVIGNKLLLNEALSGNGAGLLSQSTGEEKIITSPDEVYSTEEALAVLDAQFSSHGFGHGTEFDSLVRELAARHLKVRPNVYLDSGETENRINAARKGVEPIYYKINQGELIVRAGDRISIGQLGKLEHLREQYSSTNLARTFIGYLLLSLAVLTCVYLFTIKTFRGFRPSNKDLAFISLALIGSFALVHVFSIIGMSLSLYFPSFGTDFFAIATPFAAAGIVLEVTIGTPAVLLLVIPYAIFTALFFQNPLLLLILVSLGTMIGAICVKHCSRRAAFLRAGLQVALVNVIVVIGFLLVSPKVLPGENAMYVLCAILSGLLAGVIAAGVAPLVEYFGSYITDIKLLELASLDHPLLRELALQAPGTWNHSMVMGHMCEIAANAIGANSLLARVGAYFHDVGKAKKPAYFVENQIGEENRHDKLTPSMSALIIRAHVKDGIEMAREHRMPKAIIDFIPQHHGKALIEYFYDRAVREAEEGEIVDENHYRYPGPKPQTKEAGILMLADAVEATSRTLSDPTPAKIKGLVQKQINRVFASGELDECELTLKDLHQIARSFTHVLSGIHHRRIEYSEPADKSRGGRGGGEGDPESTIRMGTVTDGNARGRLADETKQSSSGGAIPVNQPERNSEEQEEKRNGSRSAGKGNGPEGSRETSSEKEGGERSDEALKRLGM